MADPIDEFFKKKDRKKSKSKKFATADELAKKLDDPNQKSEVKPKKERPVQEGDESGGGAVEEEWKEYEEPVKDYTGLKIQVLQGGNGASESRDSASEDNAPDNGKVKGPWNKPSEGAPTAAPPPVVEEKPRSPVAPRSQAYVPPSRLRAAAEPPPRKPLNRNAPDIHNDDNFPVLGGAGPRVARGGGAGGGGGWSTAVGRPGAAHAGGAARPHKQTLALGNSFNTLQDDS